MYLCIIFRHPWMTKASVQYFHLLVPSLVQKCFQQQVITSRSILITKQKKVVALVLLALAQLMKQKRPFVK